MESGTTTAPICSRPEKDVKSRFEVTFDGVAFHFYNQESNMYMCKGSIDSLNGQFLVAKTLDSDQCWIVRKWLLQGMDDQESKGDVIQIHSADLEEYELYWKKI